MVEWLFLAVPWGCLRFVIVVFPDHTHLLFLFIVTPIVGVYNCSMFCCTLLYIHSSIAIILMGKRELAALRKLSLWCLVMVEWLILPVPWGCLRCVIVVFQDHTHLLFLFIVTPIVGVCNCSMFCCTLLYVHSRIAIILMGKRELVALLNLSSWCHVMIEWLFLAVPWGCLRCVIVVFPDHTRLPDQMYCLYLVEALNDILTYCQNIYYLCLKYRPNIRMQC